MVPPNNLPNGSKHGNPHYSQREGLKRNYTREPQHSHRSQQQICKSKADAPPRGAKF